MLKSVSKIDQIKYEIRNKTIDIWSNPDNPPEDKLVDILEYTTEKIINYFEKEDI